MSSFLENALNKDTDLVNINNLYIKYMVLGVGEFESALRIFLARARKKLACTRTKKNNFFA